MFVVGIWIDFDIEEIISDYQISLKITDMLSKNKVKILLFARYASIPKIQLDLKYNIDVVIRPCFFYENQIPFSVLKEVDCWLFPGVFEINPLPAWVPSVVIVPIDSEFDSKYAESDFQFDVFGGGAPDRLSFISDASLCLALSDVAALNLVNFCRIPVARIRTLDLSKNESSEDLFLFLKEAKAISSLDSAQRSGRLFRPWGSKPVRNVHSGGPPEVFLFLPTIFPGGIWQASRDLITDLVEINQERRCLTFTLGVPDDVGEEGFLWNLGQNILLDRFQLIPITLWEAKTVLGDQFSKIRYNCDMYSFFKGCEEQALHADAWFSLTDRFSFPLLPIRPYGVLVYDVIQKLAPETFPPRFFESVQNGMTPTLQNAEVVVTGGESVRKDVIDFYQLDPSLVKMFPISADPANRFRGKKSFHVRLPFPFFFLQVANMAPHKGVHVSLVALALLRKSMGTSAPALVICGTGTELLSSKVVNSDISPYIKKCRDIIGQYNLVEGRDFIGLGFVKEEELLDLYQRSMFVLNASRDDLGTLCAIEANYFGKLVVSSRYPAIEEMASRFDLPVSFFNVGDSSELSAIMERIIEMKQNVTNQNFNQIMSYNNKNLSHRYYAEKIYDLLVDLGNNGRKLRMF